MATRDTGMGPAGTGDAVGFTYQGDALRHVAMPLGGLGAGQIALCGDGALRQWQIVNQANHLAFVPDSFFLLRASSPEPPRDVLRILQSREVLQLPHADTPLVNDNHIPLQQRHLLDRFPGVDRTRFTGAYPFARIAYEDSALPVEIELEAWSPLVPLDPEASGLPAILFTFQVRNLLTVGVHGCLAAALQNMVGWDGVTPITGTRCSLYGGNVNQVRFGADRVSIVMDNPSLAGDDPRAGQAVLAALAAEARPYERWTSPEDLVRHVEGFNLDQQLDDPSLERFGFSYSARRAHKNGPTVPTGPSPRGSTWNGALLVPFRLAPGESTTITFVYAWYFPNRYVNFDQFGPPREYGKSRFWLGNAYATQFGHAEEVLDHVQAQRDRLYEKTSAWTESLFAGSLPSWLAEALVSQSSVLRSPTCFWTADGKFFGFEGCLGESTSMWNGSYGGSCPLNCTHVWNYEQALSRLFPALEKTMRETEVDIMQAPEGYIPHRVYMPVYLPQLWNEMVGGPEAPALDGMLGTVLKVYREVRQGVGADWLKSVWPSVNKLLSYVMEHWDQDGDGVVTGDQPNTYDISFHGANMFIGGLWLAALRASEEMARLLGDSQRAVNLREIFELGSERYDALLWNGEYYAQRLEGPDPREYQYGEGCLADQLIGQWWAHQLELGHILPPEHVRGALQSIVRFNFRRGFRDFEHGYRVFADQDDHGLLVCTWPRGGRPAVPVRYADEVWTGIEYQVGAHCIMEGLVDEGLVILRALRARYSGVRRNPYNEIECGDHYARSMAGWSVLEALSGFRFSALDRRLRFAPAVMDGRFQVPFLAGTGWGVYEQHGRDPWSRITLQCRSGDLQVGELVVPPRHGEISVLVDRTPVSVRVDRSDSELVIHLEDSLVLGEDATLEIAARSC